MFWGELCLRLAEKDLIQEKGIKKVKEMDSIDRMTEEDIIGEKYNKEFKDHGLKNLIISDK